MPKRPRIPEKLKQELLVEAGHACTICGDPGVQIHHIDGDPTNNNEDNLIVLCLAHHDEAEKSKTAKGLSANLTPDALREYKRRLKAGYRPLAGQPTPASMVDAKLHDVKDSRVIISAGDVTVTAPLTSQSTREEQKAKTSAGKETNEQARPTIGIITALPKEYVAVKALLDNPKEFAVAGRGAGRRYLLGEVRAADGSKHSIVLALADMGNNIAAARATLLLEHFPNIDSIIMVGIAGGVPHPEKPDEHVRLGDVVVSNQRGVIQYDFDKETVSETIYRYPPRPPSAALLEGVRLVEVAALEGKRPWLKFIDQAMHLLGWTRPLEKTDILASSTSPEQVIPHPKDPKREKGQPRIFIGPIASANKLLKNPIKRDELRDRFGVKAVEMEGSGIADATWNHEVGYLVVRGICDYCDANKGDDWQEYAAIVAAAYTRALLGSIPGQSISSHVSSSASVEASDGEKFSLLQRFRPSDEDLDKELLPWQAQVDRATIDTDEPDIHYLDALLTEDSTPPDDEQRAVWCEQLAIHRGNLNKLELQLAKYGSLNAPLHLLNQIEDEKAEIERLEVLLGS